MVARAQSGDEGAVEAGGLGLGGAEALLLGQVQDLAVETLDQVRAEAVTRLIQGGAAGLNAAQQPEQGEGFFAVLVPLCGAGPVVVQFEEDDSQVQTRVVRGRAVAFVEVAEDGSEVYQVEDAADEPRGVVIRDSALKVVEVGVIIVEGRLDESEGESLAARGLFG